MKKSVNCSSCQATGLIETVKNGVAKVCPQCNGTGAIRVSYHSDCNENFTGLRLNPEIHFVIIKDRMTGMETLVPYSLWAKPSKKSNS